MPVVKRTIERRRRGTFGKIILWVFYLGNAFFLLSLVKLGMQSPTKETPEVAIMGFIAAGVYSWFAFFLIGGIIVLLTRGPREYIEVEETINSVKA
jgi:hypothetical protein